MPTYQSLFLQTLFLWPQTAGWLLCHSHMPEQNRQETQAQRDMKYIHTFTRCYIILLDRVSDLLVFFQGHARLCSIWSFNENQLIFLDILQDALRKHVQRSVSQETTLCGHTFPASTTNTRPRRHLRITTGHFLHTDLFIPSSHYVLHVNIAGEKRYDAIGNNGRHLQEKVAIVTNHSWKTNDTTKLDFKETL